MPFFLCRLCLHGLHTYSSRWTLFMRKTAETAVYRRRLDENKEPEPPTDRASRTHTHILQPLPVMLGSVWRAPTPVVMPFGLVLLCLVLFGSFLARRGGLRRQRQPFVVVIGHLTQLWIAEILRVQLLFALSGRQEQQQAWDNSVFYPLGQRYVLCVGRPSPQVAGESYKVVDSEICPLPHAMQRTTTVAQQVHSSR